MKILGIIPARGGSKRLPSKNILKLVNQPLISYTINAAKNSKLINKIILSTDSKKIAKLYNSEGINLPFLRPKNLAQHNTPIIKVIEHTLSYLKKNENYEPDIIILLQPTSPFRTSQMIDKSIQLLIESRASSVVSVTKTKIHPAYYYNYKKNYLTPYNLIVNHNYIQKTSEVYIPTGSIYTFWNKTLKKYNSIYGPKIKPLFMNNIETIDIDDIFDFFVSNMIILHWKKFKQKHKTRKITKVKSVKK